jgi:heme exporter protein D
MMPDLGKYAFAVLASYAGGGALIVAIILHTLWRGRRVARALSEAELALRAGKDG